jgi:hypothetical protein
MKIALLSLGLLAANLLLPGCGRGDGGGTASGGTIGVEPCDAYVARLEACAGKMPAEARPPHESAIRTARDLLEEKADKAESDGDRVALADACREMAEALAGRPGCD